MRAFAIVTVLALGLATSACSGSGYSSGSTNSQAAPTPITSTASLPSMSSRSTARSRSRQPRHASGGPDGRLAQRQQHDPSCRPERRIGGHRQSRARGVESADGDRRGRRSVSLFDSSGNDRQPQSRHRAVFAHAGLLDHTSWAKPTIAGVESLHRDHRQHHTPLCDSRPRCDLCAGRGSRRL